MVPKAIPRCVKCGKGEIDRSAGEGMAKSCDRFGNLGLYSGIRCECRRSKESGHAFLANVGFGRHRPVY